MDDGWDKKEIAPGVTEMTRKDIASGGVRLLDDTPWIHLHYLTEDETAEKQGYSITELCCHECGVALYIFWTWPTPEEEATLADGNEGLPRLREARDTFQDQHRKCQGPLSGRFTMLCPPTDRTKTTTLDLR